MAGILELAKTTLADASNVTVLPDFRDSPLVEYMQVDATSSMSKVPRFGHSSNISDLFLSGDEVEVAEAREDYIWGLVFVGGFLLAVFSIWSVLLLALKCWGCCCRSSIPGFLSGRPLMMDAEDDKTTPEKLSAWEHRCKRVRGIFMLSGILLIVSMALFFLEGLQKVEETRGIADTSLDNVRVLIDEASVLTEDLRDVGTSAIDLRDKLVLELDQDRLCPNNPNYLAQDEITKAIEDNAGAAIDMLEVLGEFATVDIQQMEDGLNTANNVIARIEGVVQDVAVEERWLWLFFLPLGVFSSLMMLGTLAAHWDRQHICFEFTLGHVVLPLFVVWIVASYLLCAGLALSASANADFCSGGAEESPDGTILLAVQNAGLDDTSVEFEIARYYLHQCTSDAKIDPFLFLRRHQAEIERAQEIVLELSTSIEKIDVDTLSYNCGRDFEPLSSSLHTMMAILDRLDEAAVSGLKLLGCDRIIPIYAEAVYEGTCNYSVSGFAWMFGTLLAISTCGMIMIMLRSAYQASILLAKMDEQDCDVHDKMGNHEIAIARGRAEASAADHDLQFREDDEWKEQPITQDTSDSGSVYTDGAELSIHQVDRENGGSVEITRSSSISPASKAGSPMAMASAPYEKDCYEDYVQDAAHSPDYQDAVANKPRVY